MDEELDYMSDEFIKSCGEGVNDVRPGLLKTHNQQREHNLMKKKIESSKNKKVPTEVLQAEVLEASLKQPIKATNKGFSMLERMGYKTGMGLGKNNSGIKEPIGINIKNDKMGLGHRTAIQEKPQKKSEGKLDKINEGDFRAFMSNKKREIMIIKDFRKSQRICKELDERSSKTTPVESWFWCDEESSEALGEDESEEVTLNHAEKLEMLTKYLRDSYYYCIWCKVQYEDEKDLEDCPGPTRDDH